MRSAVRKLGNSTGVIIPKSLLAEAGVSAGDVVDMTCEKGRIVMAPVKPQARVGWKTASAAIAEAGDDQLVWPEFGNLGDKTLDW